DPGEALHEGDVVIVRDLERIRQQEEPLERDPEEAAEVGEDVADGAAPPERVDLRRLHRMAVDPLRLGAESRLLEFGGAEFEERRRAIAPGRVLGIVPRVKIRAQLSGREDK